MEATERAMSLSDLARRAADIWFGGACNPRALARELVRAIDAACETCGSGGPAEADEGAPARVILAQLCSLMRAEFDGIGGSQSPHGDIWADLARCEATGKEADK